MLKKIQKPEKKSSFRVMVIRNCNYIFRHQGCSAKSPAESPDSPPNSLPDSRPYSRWAMLNATPQTPRATKRLVHSGSTVHLPADHKADSAQKIGGYDQVGQQPGHRHPTGNQRNNIIVVHDMLNGKQQRTRGKQVVANQRQPG